MKGRGYAGNGMGIAAGYLDNEFKAIGLKPLNSRGYLQPFSYPVNIFPGKMNVILNGKTLRPGRDYLISPESRGVKGSGRFIQADSNVYVNRDHAVIVTFRDKLTWSVADKLEDYTAIIVKNGVIDEPKSFSAIIDQQFDSAFKAANVIGYVPGTSRPDSFIVITAHYDHLGMMGEKTLFPGANDNASGVALLLALAKQYAKNPAPYSVAFMAFAGEEAGLRGSEFYTNNPLVPLSSISFLLNTDLAGTGEDGITVVNATEFPEAFKLMQQINDRHQYLKEIRSRGKAANSDHYFFSEKVFRHFSFIHSGA